jgi:hypothetical protein
MITSEIFLETGRSVCSSPLIFFLVVTGRRQKFHLFHNAMSVVWPFRWFLHSLWTPCRPWILYVLANFFSHIDNVFSIHYLWWEAHIVHILHIENVWYKMGYVLAMRWKHIFKWIYANENVSTIDRDPERRPDWEIRRRDWCDVNVIWSTQHGDLIRPPPRGQFEFVGQPRHAFRRRYFQFHQ